MTNLAARVLRGAKIAAAVTLFLASSPITGAQAQEFRWDMPNEYGATTVTAIADKVFSDLLERNSGGRIVITHHFGGSLGFRTLEHWAAVEDGAAPLASSFIGAFAGIDPIFTLTSLPLLAVKPSETRLLVNAAKDEFDAAFAKGGQMLLFAEPWVPTGLWSRQPVATLEDMRTLRMRTYDKSSTAVMSRLGVNAIQMTWGDVASALATNAIDSVLAGVSVGLSANFQDFMKNYLPLNYVMGVNLVHINRDVFESLPEDLQRVLLDTAQEAETIVWEMATEALVGVSDDLAAAGVTLAPAPSAELLTAVREASVPVIDEWKASLPAGVADGILSRYEALLAERQ